MSLFAVDFRFRSFQMTRERSCWQQQQQQQSVFLRCYQFLFAHLFYLLVKI